MPTTKATPLNMTTAKRPASKRKSSRRPAGASKHIEAAFRGLQTTLQTPGAAVPSLRYRTFDQQACFSALMAARPHAMSAREISLLHGAPLIATLKAMTSLASRGDILLYEGAYDPADTKWKAPCVGDPSKTAVESTPGISDHVRDREAESKRIKAEDDKLKNTLGWWIYDNKGWPRYFELPGLAGVNQFTADDVIHLLARVIHEWEDELHALAARHAHDRPNKVAEFAEVLAICEQIVCSGGLATDLDDTPIGGNSPRLLLAALSKQQCIVKRPRPQTGKPQRKGGQSK